jgi:hypothetical protein
MSEITQGLVDRIIADRPFKLNAEEVNYRPANGEDPCDTCIHLFKRVLDGFHTCEIFRDEQTDEKGVDPTYVCDFWNDGKETEDAHSKS